MEAGNDMLSVYKQSSGSACRAVYGGGRTAQHHLVGYHVKHRPSMITTFVFNDIPAIKS
jgi:mevalonate pyrophosphate decarboxylase